MLHIDLTENKSGEIDAIPDNAYKHLALCFVITYWSRLLLLNSVIIPIIDLYLSCITQIIQWEISIQKIVGKVFSEIKQARLMDICNSIFLYFYNCYSNITISNF